MIAKANMKTQTTPRADRLFRAFAQRTRLRILHLLRTGETCVGDLVTILRLPQPTVSRHLAYLRRSGLVTVREEGRWAYYTLSPAKSRFHQKLLDCLLACFDEVPEIARDASKKGTLRKGGKGCC
jgi:ArsR family transcriptional regulator